MSDQHPHAEVLASLTEGAEEVAGRLALAGQLYAAREIMGLVMALRAVATWMLRAEAAAAKAASPSPPECDGRTAEGPPTPAP